MTTAEATAVMRSFADVINGPVGSGALLLQNARRRYIEGEISVEEFETLVEKALRD